MRGNRDSDQLDEESPRRKPVREPEGDSSKSADPASIELDKLEVERANRIQEESWIKSYWRPGMGWLYMLICFTDFVFFPLLAMFIPVILKSGGVTDATYVPWTSLTLAHGGLIHLAFGAILGVTAWTRGMEKLHLGRRQ